VNDVIDVRPPERGAPGSAAIVRCVPLPDWVKHQGYSADVSGAGDAYIDNGLCRLHYDSQVNFEGVGFANSLRTVQRVITRAGAEKAAHFVIEFDPTHQQIDVHFIRVLRGEIHVDHANAESLQLLRRETKLERLALNGRLTATLLIPDLRIDDVLDVSITIHSNHPILGGKYAGWVAFNAFAPWLEVRHRLLRPPEREVFEKPFNQPPDGVVLTTHGKLDSVWSLDAQGRREQEELTPPWQLLLPAIQLTEFCSWDQVAQLFYPHYSDSALPTELSAEIDRVASEYPDSADRAGEWLRFVQRQLRYFALALGEGALVPRALDVIWASRFGDCKDAARVFVAGARKLGIDACAALVSTTHGPALGDFLPSPAAFNHCIVRLRLDGRTYWLDPTMPRQEGRLDVIYQPHAGWALPLIPGATLERLKDDEPVHYRHSEGVLIIGRKPDTPTGLTIRIDLYSFAADALRHRIENEGHSKYSEQVINELRATWPDLVETAPLSLEDERRDNRLTATFRYEIRNGWKSADKKGRQTSR
jgi:transglutaminase-like putative cysteine protease